MYPEHGQYQHQTTAGGPPAVKGYPNVVVIYPRSALQIRTIGGTYSGKQPRNTKSKGESGNPREFPLEFLLVPQSGQFRFFGRQVRWAYNRPPRLARKFFL
jgi:hypothetical protein